MSRVVDMMDLGLSSTHLVLTFQTARLGTATKAFYLENLHLSQLRAQKSRKIESRSRQKENGIFLGVPCTILDTLFLWKKDVF